MKWHYWVMMLTTPTEFVAKISINIKLLKDALHATNINFEYGTVVFSHDEFCIYGTDFGGYAGFDITIRKDDISNVSPSLFPNIDSYYYVELSPLRKFVAQVFTLSLQNKSYDNLINIYAAKDFLFFQSERSMLLLKIAEPEVPKRINFNQQKHAYVLPIPLRLIKTILSEKMRADNIFYIEANKDGSIYFGTVSNQCNVEHLVCQKITPAAEMKEFFNAVSVATFLSTIKKGKDVVFAFDIEMPLIIQHAIGNRSFVIFSIGPLFD